MIAIKMHPLGAKEVTWSELQNAHSDAELRKKEKLAQADGLRTGGCVGVRIDTLSGGTCELYSPERPMVYQGKIFVPPIPNLVVNSGVHISMQRTFVTLGGATLTPVSGTTNAGVRYGGIDNVAGATVDPTTNRFDTSTGNRYIALLQSTPSYTSATKRMDDTFRVQNTDTSITHERVGFTTDSANSANTLFSMIADYAFNPGVSLTYDLTYGLFVLGSGS